MSRTKLVSLALSLAVATLGAMPAHAANLVTNGSFEDGLNSWIIGGTFPNYPPVAITYGSASAYPTGAFGEAVPANNAPTFSPDPVGQHAAYFVTDFATNQSLSQSITVLTGGLYQVGFSAYAPANGYANFFDATFSAVVVVPLANYSVSSGPATTWQTFASSGLNLAAGNYNVQFVFNTNGFPAKDVVIDQVYVIPGDPGRVPEPGTLALLGLGLVGLGLARRRKTA